jgi:hypothetical protein
MALAPFYPKAFWQWAEKRLCRETLEHIRSEAGTDDRDRCLGSFVWEKHLKRREAAAAKIAAALAATTNNTTSI